MDTSGYESLEALMLGELKNIFDAERYQAKFLSKLLEGIVTEELKMAFQEHLKETEEQILRLKNIFKAIKTEAKSTLCKPVRALIRDAVTILKKDNSLLKDVELVSFALKLENYEMASYNIVISQAKQLGHDTDLLQASLAEETKMNKTLTKILDGSVFKMGITSQIATMP